MSDITSLIYVGPRISRHRLIPYTVFIGGYPKHIDDVFEECPQIRKLFVPISELTEAKKQVAKAGTPLNKYYKLAQGV